MWIFGWRKRRRREGWVNDTWLLRSSPLWGRFMATAQAILEPLIWFGFIFNNLSLCVLLYYIILLGKLILWERNNPYSIPDLPCPAFLSMSWEYFKTRNLRRFKKSLIWKQKTHHQLQIPSLSHSLKDTRTSLGWEAKDMEAIWEGEVTGCSSRTPYSAIIFLTQLSFV